MRVRILGAGAGGLSAAYMLVGAEGISDLRVIEASPRYGGLTRSFEWNGFVCDIAPHRLFTEDQQLLAEMLELTPMDEIPRQSKIFIGGKWIGDPVNAVEIMYKFFPRSIGIALSYLATKFKKPLPDNNFDALCLNQFGTGLNEFFFKPYSEKLFGIPADQISATWGRRKIRVGGLKDMIRRNSKLYFRKFYYPKKGGYGAICDALHERVKDEVSLNTKLVAIAPLEGGTGYRLDYEGPNGPESETCELVISSLPISLLSRLLGKEFKLEFRAAKVLYLLINKPRVTQNHWFYFADAKHVINRVAEFKNFSSNGVPADKTVICCEVTRTEDFSVDRVVADLEHLGAFTKADVLDSMVIDVPLAYPIYDLGYDEEIARANAFFAANPRIFNIGRHAQFAHRDIDEIYDAAKEIKEAVLKFAAAQNRQNGSPSVGIAA